MTEMTSSGNEYSNYRRENLEHEQVATVCVAETIRTAQSLLDRVQRICQHYGLTLSTANVLGIVDGADAPLSPQTIRERLLVTGGAVTQFLDTLEQRGLVRRVGHPTDRRSVLVEITDAGRRVRHLVQPYLQQRDEAWMAGLTTDEQESFIRLLVKIQQHLATVVEPSTPPQEASG